MVMMAWHRTQGDLHRVRAMFMLTRAEESAVQESERS